MKIIEKNLFRNGFNADSALTRSPSWTRLAQEQAERARMKQEAGREKKERTIRESKRKLRDPSKISRICDLYCYTSELMLVVLLFDLSILGALESDKQIYKQKLCGYFY